MVPKFKTVKFTAEFTFTGWAKSDADFKELAQDIISEPRSQATGHTGGYLQFVKAGKIKRV
jgi:hypothetical protein